MHHECDTLERDLAVSVSAAVTQLCHSETLCCTDSADVNELSLSSHRVLVQLCRCGYSLLATVYLFLRMNRVHSTWLSDITRSPVGVLQSTMYMF